MRSAMVLLLALVVTVGLASAAVPLGDWDTQKTPGIDATGGPDAYGYIWIDSNEPGGPVLNWIDITATGTLVTGLGDDNWVGPFNFGFPFHFYWYDVTQYYIGSNGYLKFGTPYNMAQPFPASIPLTSTPNDFIGVYIADWFPGQFGQGSVYQWTNNADSLIVSFIEIPEWTTTPPAGSHDFQVIMTDTDSSITFQYGSQTGTVSNNDILIGIENINGQVGLEHSHDLLVASNYVVRYEYPASTSYIVHDMAVIASANENSQGFFVVNGETIQPWAKVKNTGNQDESTFEVQCLIENEAGTPFYYQTVTAGPLTPGQELEVNFPLTWTPTINQQYFFEVTVVLTGDMNPNNDEKWTEMHVLDLPGVLLYDDGTNEGSWTWMGGDGGLGQHFEPPTYPVRIDDIRFFIPVGSSTLPFTGKIFDDDGAGGSPGTELFTQDVNAPTSNQWYTVDVSGQNIEITEGGFYVSWHMTGENSPAMGTDFSAGQIGSRQSWEYTGVWSQFRYAEDRDVMIRCQVSEPGAVYDWDVTLTYVSGSPIPAGGGYLGYDAAVMNNETSTVTGDAWLDVTLPNSQVMTILTRELTLPGLASLTRSLSTYVPAYAPAGSYTMTGKVGDYPGTIWDSDSFPFEKSAGDDAGWIQEGMFTLYGWDEPCDMTRMDRVPEEFAVDGNYPNPFNPETTISYQLSDAALINLSVYDTQGRKVQELVSGWRTAGVHHAVFDAGDLASGIYIYRLQAGNYSASGKMVLMK